MLTLLADRKVTIITTGDTGNRDRLNNPIMGEVSRRENVLARLEQTGTVEGTEYVENQWIGYFFDLSISLTSADKVIDGERTFQVDGAPSQQAIPGFPAMDHVLARLTYVGG